jgi:hypothetical protein
LTSNTIAKVVNNHWCQQVNRRHHQHIHQPALLRVTIHTNTNTKHLISTHLCAMRSEPFTKPASCQAPPPARSPASTATLFIHNRYPFFNMYINRTTKTST